MSPMRFMCWPGMLQLLLERELLNGDLLTFWINLLNPRKQGKKSRHE